MTVIGLGNDPAFCPRRRKTWVDLAFADHVPQGIGRYAVLQVAVTSERGLCAPQITMFGYLVLAMATISSP